MISRSGFFAGPVREWLYLRGGRRCVLLILIAALMPVAGRAQDVAEAGRQEKARKAAQGARQSHVYTNEDLQKAEIVSREESAAAQAQKKNSDGASKDASVATRSAAEPVVNVPATDAGEKVVASESLGEVARRYRREKAVRQAQRARANLPASQFHLDVTTPALAEIAPRRVFSTPVTAPALSVARSIQPRKSGAPAKRDPFLRPELGRLEVAKRPAAMNALISGTTAKEIVASNPSGAKAAVRPANNGADGVAGTTRAKNAPAMIANGIAIPSKPSASLVVTTGWDGMVVVRTGDSLWRLSRQYSGAGAQWHEWLAVNPGVDEKRLRPGMKLVRPGVASRAGVGSASPRANLRQTITVRPGDSLWKIAAERYGDGRLWPCIGRANAEWRDMEKIYPGQTLLVPAACGK